MRAFAQTLAEDRRLSLLLVLEQTPGYSANVFLLRDAIAAVFGHDASVDVVSTELAWLAEQGRVSLRDAGGVTLATLATRGADVAAGRATVPGVKRPQP